MRLGFGEIRAGFEAFGDDLIGCLAAENALASGVVGGVEAAQKVFELAVGVDGDAEHFTSDATIEPLDQAVGLRCTRSGVSVLRTERAAGFSKGRHEAAAIVGQHVGDPERESGSRRNAMALFSVLSSLTAR